MRDPRLIVAALMALCRVTHAQVPITPAHPVTHAPQRYHGCPINGLTKIANLRTLNRAKNRFVAPKVSDIDQTVTLQAMEQPGADIDRFDPTRAAVIEGFVVGIKVGGVETVNCKAADSLFRDTHIEIALTNDHHLATTKRVIVEVTPRWRYAMEKQGADWTTEGLAAALLGRKVRFTGWLLFDVEHLNEAVNTDPADAKGKKNWRATDWEIHPVTSIKVLP
jgi:hypothetical protein